MKKETKYFLKWAAFHQAVIALIYMCIYALALFYDPIPLWGLPLIMGLVFIIQLLAVYVLTPLEEWWMDEN